MIKKDKEKNEAKKLRANGMSIKEIAKKLNVSQASVSLWVSDVLLTEEQKNKLQERNPISKLYAGRKASELNATKARIKRLEQQFVGRKEIGGFDLHLAGCMLYWCEGSKNRNSLTLTNYDPKLLKLFIQFLRDCFNVLDTDFKIYIAHYSEENIVKLENFWLDLLKLPKSCLGKLRVVKSEPKMKSNRHEFGGCSISVYSTELAQRVYGSIKEYIGCNDDNLWLN